jgi:MFS transporter, DHA1 family, tetracycline resistance protein
MNRSALIVLTLTAFVDMLGFSIILPVLPYYAETYGASPTVVGLLFASYSLMQFFFAPVWGSISDRVGRKPILVMGLLGACVGLVIFGLATSLIVLFASRVFAGIMAATVPVAQAYAADVTEPEHRAKAMGMLGAAIGLGFVCGPAIGGVLATFGRGVPAFVAAGIAFVNAIWTIVALKESLKPQIRSDRWLPIQALRTIWRKPAIVLLLAVFFVNVFAFAAMEATFALLVEDVFYPGLPHSELARRVGYFLGFAGVIMVIVQGGLLGRLVDRFGEARLIPVGLAFIIGGLVIMPLLPTFGWVLVSLAFLSIGVALIRPNAFSIMSRLVSSEVQGGVLSIGQALGSLARAAGPAWGGWMYHTMGSSAPFLYGSGITGVALLGSIVLITLLPQSLRGPGRHAE